MVLHATMTRDQMTLMTVRISTSYSSRSRQQSTMKFPRTTKAAFLATLSLLSISTAFTARRSFASTLNIRRSTFRPSLAPINHPTTNAWANRKSLAVPLALRGGTGSALFSAAATSTAVAPKEICRKDYKPLAYKVSNVSMKFVIREGKTLVDSELTVVPGEGDGDLILDGEADCLTLLSIQLNGKDLTEGKDYTIIGNQLTIPASVLGNDKSKISTKVEIVPEKNTRLSGLFKSGNMYITQCEAEGFRCITYYPDRPDNLAVFDQVRIEADKEAYPVLLGNGNKIQEGAIEGGRHFAVWQDPFPKPSYLFCIVAGKLGSIYSTYTTRPSGRKVHLEVFAEPGNQSKLDHALESLKKSMKWDEDTFGLEYDLDIYNIVAVNDFNMGAMENKGLNVFNTPLVLADPKSATDEDYERVQAVVGHEYFHNWTGNRVTCRDWFQLTLKEGLTVYRDREFTGDMMNSHEVKRIEDVMSLRARQFAEDAGPMSHPIRPETYVIIDNFYTSTVYDKGAEVIGMYRTLLGKEGFRKGMDLYIERHDGSAATCEDFLIAMSDANGKDLSQFARWYSTKGTPMVKYDGKYDVEASTYYLTLTQESTSADPLHIPVAVGLLDKKSGDEVVATQILELKNTTQTFEFRGLINGDVLPSMLRGFSAPVKLVGSSEDEVKDWAFLAAHDTDGFNRWDSGQKLYGKAIFQTLRGEDCSKTMDCIYDAFKRYLAIDTNDLSIQAFSLKLPSESTLSEEMTTIDPIGLHKARGDVKKSIARRFYSQIRAKYDELSTATEGKESSIDAESIGQRRLRNELLDYLCAVNETPYEREAASQLAFDQFNSSYGMTNKYAALSCLVSMDGEEKVIERRESAIKQFYQDAEGDDLIKNKWFTVQAGADLPDTVDRVKALAKHPDFTLSNPNRFRSLVATFSANAPHFHSVDGEGYKFLGDLVNQVDKLNPQTSSRYGKPLIQWKRYNEEQGALMKAELQKLADMKPISNDLFEVICRGLKD